MSLTCNTLEKKCRYEKGNRSYNVNDNVLIKKILKIKTMLQLKANIKTAQHNKIKQ